jgi:nucleoside-diphosphate-sugar epimerase
VRKYVGFSSGAAVHLAGMDSFSLAQNPYAAQKQEYETTMANIDVRQGCDVTIARVWSVSGAYMTKPSSFAISNLIQQAKAGIIEILSSGPVYRRYCAIEDVISVGLATQSAPGKRIFDTGGDLIELGELAEIIGEEISPKIQIVRKFKPMLRSDSYHSDGEDWRMLSQRFDLGFDSIPNQVARLARFIN